MKQQSFAYYHHPDPQQKLQNSKLPHGQSSASSSFLSSSRGNKNQSCSSAIDQQRTAFQERKNNVQTHNLGLRQTIQVHNENTMRTLSQNQSCSKQSLTARQKENSSQPQRSPFSLRQRQSSSLFGQAENYSVQGLQQPQCQLASHNSSYIYDQLNPNQIHFNEKKSYHRSIYDKNSGMGKDQTNQKTDSKMNEVRSYHSRVKSQLAGGNSRGASIRQNSKSQSPSPFKVPQKQVSPLPESKVKNYKATSQGKYNQEPRSQLRRSSLGSNNGKNNFDYSNSVEVQGIQVSRNEQMQKEILLIHQAVSQLSKQVSQRVSQNPPLVKQNQSDSKINCSADRISLQNQNFGQEEQRLNQILAQFQELERQLKCVILGKQVQQNQAHQIQQLSQSNCSGLSGLSSRASLNPGIMQQHGNEFQIIQSQIQQLNERDSMMKQTGSFKVCPTSETLQSSRPLDLQTILLTSQQENSQRRQSFQTILDLQNSFVKNEGVENSHYFKPQQDKEQSSDLQSTSMDKSISARAQMPCELQKQERALKQNLKSLFDKENLQTKVSKSGGDTCRTMVKDKYGQMLEKICSHQDKSTSLVRSSKDLSGEKQRQPSSNKKVINRSPFAKKQNTRSSQQQQLVPPKVEQRRQQTNESLSQMESIPEPRVLKLDDLYSHLAGPNPEPAPVQNRSSQISQISVTQDSLFQTQQVLDQDKAMQLKSLLDRGVKNINPQGMVGQDLSFQDKVNLLFDILMNQGPLMPESQTNPILKQDPLFQNNKQDKLAQFQSKDLSHQSSISQDLNNSKIAQNFREFLQEMRIKEEKALKHDHEKFNQDQDSSFSSQGLKLNLQKIVSPPIFERNMNLNNSSCSHSAMNLNQSSSQSLHPQQNRVEPKNSSSTIDGLIHPQFLDQSQQKFFQQDVRKEVSSIINDFKMDLDQIKTSHFIMDPQSQMQNYIYSQQMVQNRNIHNSNLENSQLSYQQLDSSYNEMNQSIQRMGLCGLQMNESNLLPAQEQSQILQSDMSHKICNQVQENKIDQEQRQFPRNQSHLIHQSQPSTQFNSAIIQNEGASIFSLPFERSQNQLIPSLIVQQSNNLNQSSSAINNSLAQNQCGRRNNSGSNSKKSPFVDKLLNQGSHFLSKKYEALLTHHRQLSMPDVKQVKTHEQPNSHSHQVNVQAEKQLDPRGTKRESVRNPSQIIMIKTDQSPIDKVKTQRYNQSKSGQRTEIKKSERAAVRGEREQNKNYFSDQSIKTPRQRELDNQKNLLIKEQSCISLGDPSPLTKMNPDNSALQLRIQNGHRHSISQQYDSRVTSKNSPQPSPPSLSNFTVYKGEHIVDFDDENAYAQNQPQQTYKQSIQYNKFFRNAYQQQNSIHENKDEEKQQTNSSSVVTIGLRSRKYNNKSIFEDIIHKDTSKVRIDTLKHTASRLDTNPSVQASLKNAKGKVNGAQTERVQDQNRSQSNQRASQSLGQRRGSHFMMAEKQGEKNCHQLRKEQLEREAQQKIRDRIAQKEKRLEELRQRQEAKNLNFLINNSQKSSSQSSQGQSLQNSMLQRDLSSQSIRESCGLAYQREGQVPSSQISKEYQPHSRKYSQVLSQVSLSKVPSQKAIGDNVFSAKKVENEVAQQSNFTKLSNLQIQNLANDFRLQSKEQLSNLQDLHYMQQISLSGLTQNQRQSTLHGQTSDTQTKQQKSSNSYVPHFNGENTQKSVVTTSTLTREKSLRSVRFADELCQEDCFEAPLLSNRRSESESSVDEVVSADPVSLLVNFKQSEEPVTSRGFNGQVYDHRRQSAAVNFEGGHEMSSRSKSPVIVVRSVKQNSNFKMRNFDISEAEC